MIDNILKPVSTSKGGKTTFYIFEISALVIGAFFIILSIYNAAQSHSLITFIYEVIQGAIYTLIVYGIGRIIDILNAKGCCKKQEQKDDEEKQN